MTVFERLNDLGFERARRAVAALALSLFISFYLVLALLLFMNGQEQWVPSFLGLAACYGIAFMGVAGEWFWGRWFASGLGWSGVMITVASIVLGGAGNPVLVTFGALHGLVVLLLAGKTMAARYDEQPAWRERYAMDEYGVARLRKTVTRASASLPSVILWALGPKEPGQAMFAALTLGAGLLAVTGLFGVIRMRAWGLLGLAAGTVFLAIAGATSYPHFGLAWQGTGSSVFSDNLVWAFYGVVAGPALPILLLGAAVAPFARPLLRHLRRA